MTSTETDETQVHIFRNVTTYLSPDGHKLAKITEDGDDYHVRLFVGDELKVASHRTYKIHDHAHAAAMRHAEAQARR